MSREFTSLPTRFGGGLNVVDSPEVLQPDEAQVLEGWRLTGRGRITTKKAARTLATVTGDIIGVYAFDAFAGTAAVILTWDDVGDVVKLYRANGSGAVTFVGNLAGWTTVAARPIVYAATLARCLFIVDQGKSYGLTVYDPNHALQGSDLFQPTFDFNDTGAGWAAIRARLVAEHLNHLWVFGYGDETDAASQDVPELAHFSYLGLEADDHGLGDAGTGGATGSLGLFDLEDAVPIGSRGVPIISVASAGGNLVVASPQMVGVIYGSDFGTFRFNQLDDERGSAVGRGMIEADGIAYWMSQLGPCRYAGGSRIEPIQRRIAPRIEDIYLDTMFAAHSIDEHQVRWYYALKTDTNPIPNRALCYDYQNDAWLDDPLGIRVFCAGSLRPSGAESPAAVPVSAAASNITNQSARANWANGDTSPSVTTEIQLDTANTFNTANLRTVSGLASGVAEYEWGSLAASTTYYYRMRHIRNGQASGYCVTIQSFLTLAAAAVATPLNLAADNSAIWNDKFLRWDPSALLSWDLGQLGVTTRIHRSTVTGFTPGSTNLIAQTALNETSYRDNNVVAQTLYYYKIIHEDGALNPSNATAQVSVTLTTVPP